MTNIRFGRVKRFGMMTDVLRAKEGTECETVEEITGGEESCDRPELELCGLLEVFGYGCLLGYGITRVVAVLFHEVECMEVFLTSVFLE